ncbi:hypothetical protein CDD83_839 [Cordyceps sp. RAO-2017]|nr:hypothetical protein CDD83_839 [Cordyceps sp. RAO-2017]
MEQHGGSTAAPRLNGLRSSSSELVVRQEGRKPLFAAGSGTRISRDSRLSTDALPGAKAQPSPRLKAARSAPPHVDAAAAKPTSTSSLGSIRRTKSDSQSSLPRLQESNGSNSPGSGAAIAQASPGGTRIPQPSGSGLHRRRPISFTEAFRRATDEALETDRAQVIDGSPSPAPRPWRAVGSKQELRMRQMLSEDHLDVKARNRQSAAEDDASGSDKAPAKPKAAPTTTASARLLARDHRSAAPSPGPWSPGRQTSPGRLRGLAAGSEDDTNGRLPDLVPGIEDVPLPSVETAGRDAARPLRPNASPEKSYAWEIEDDFTAGDLQVSDSPRIRVGSNRPFAHRPPLIGGDDKTAPTSTAPTSPARLALPGSRNTKLDEIRARELNLIDEAAEEAEAERTPPRPRNTKLDEIRAREKAVEEQIPIPDRNAPRPKNTKLDEIRQREAEGLSRRAYAAARLEEIREQNSMSRSVSPEEARPPSSYRDHHNQHQHQQHGRTQQPQQPQQPQPQPQLQPPPQTHAPDQPPRSKTPARELLARTKSVYETGGERIPDTPITVFKKQRHADADAGAAGHDKKPADKGPDSHDLLRRLARAASASPAPDEEATRRRRQPSPSRELEAETQGPRAKPAAVPAPSPEKPRKTRSATASSRDNEGPRPTVGFKGLRRTDSIESAKSKRSSMQSEIDPTDRIEAEIRLFAPNENQSERGSVRAPSPPPDSDDDDDDAPQATPRPRAQDLASMPTPRVTGAYVETPATVRVERRRDEAEERETAPKADQPARGDEIETSDSRARTKIGWRTGDQDTASDPGASDHKDEDDAVSTALAVRRRRARSLPRRRRPALKNSAKLPRC